MQRLLKISFDQALLSLTPILSWFCLSLIVDKNLISVFTITYPLQCIYGIIRCPFATGANISKSRDKNKNAVMSGLVIGVTLTLLIYGFAILNIDSFIEFMNMDPAIYRTFSIYAVLILIIQTIFSFILEKLYYEDQNSRANRYSFTFNFLNFCLLIGTSLITKNQVIIVAITCTIMALYTLIILAKNCEKFRFRLNIAHCIKYDSATLVSYITSFFVFLFGLSNALEFGPQYGLAITFAQLITDTQWDIVESIGTLAKVDLAKRRFNLKQTAKNARKLLFILYGTIAIMFFCLYRFYDLDLGITLIYLGLEAFDFFLTTDYYIYTSLLQLNWSPAKMTANKFITRIARVFCSFIPSPFCTNIGAIQSSIYQITTGRYFLHKHFTVSKSGIVRKRPTRRATSRRLQYNDIVIGKE